MWHKIGKVICHSCYSGHMITENNMHELSSNVKNRVNLIMYIDMLSFSFADCFSPFMVSAWTFVYKHKLVICIA